jgi:hypothetical protein
MNIQSIQQREPVTLHQAGQFLSQEAMPQQKPDTFEQSASSSAAESPKKKWTVLYYAAGDNDLKKNLFTDLNEIESVGSDENTNIVAQADLGMMDCKRYCLEKDPDLSVINSAVLKDLGKTNMADPETLADFIEWGVKNYPAEHYFVIISDHGQAWRGAVQDDSHLAWMTLPDIQAGFSAAQDRTGVKVDVIGFDACLMANTEVAYQLKDSAQFLVGSEMLESSEGWPFVKILDEKKLSALQDTLRERITMEPRDLVMKIVGDTEGSTEIDPMSATDLSVMPELAKASDEMAGKIIDTKTPGNVIYNIIKNTQNFYGYYDLGDFCDSVVKSIDVKDKDLKESAQKVHDILGRAVIAERHSDKYPKAHGLTVELMPDDDYDEVAFAKDTNWRKGVESIYGHHY